jgi:hypothetical protein
MDEKIFSELVIFPAWQREFREVLRETDRLELFRLVEVAEATIRGRLDAIRDSAEHRAEREAITNALNTLSHAKRDRLAFTPLVRSARQPSTQQWKNPIPRPPALVLGKQVFIPANLTRPSGTRCFQPQTRTDRGRCNPISAYWGR